MAHRIASTLFVLILGAILASPVGVSALATSLPVTPDPSLCTAKPMTADELVTAATSGMAMIVASPPATADTFSFPQGKPADQKSIDAITETIIGALACSNAGNLMAYFSSYGDAALATLLAGEGITADTLAQTAAALANGIQVDSAKYASLVGVREVALLPDGSVGMLVDTIFPTTSTDVQTDYLVFTEKEGKWIASTLVGNLEALFGPTAGTAPTPTPVS